MKRNWAFLPVACLLIALMAPLETASAQTGLPQLTAQWWQWVFSIPNAVSPLLLSDPDAQCMVGQSGPVWFLAGSFGGAPITRHCSVPENLPLFFPVINNVQFNSPDLCGQGSESYSVKELRENIKPLVDAAENLSVKVDGQPLPKQAIVRVKSPAFAIAMPSDNLFGGPPAGCPAGVYSPTVTDGFWSTVGPLKAGEHILYFHAESGGFRIDVTYDLTVVPVSLK